jgi:hypothetical protein
MKRRNKCHGNATIETIIPGQQYATLGNVGLLADQTFSAMGRILPLSSRFHKSYIVFS